MESRVEELRVKFRFQNKFCVDRVGRGGGLATLWKDSSHCDVSGYSSNHIDFVIHDVEVGDWCLTCFYGYPDRNKRRDSWNLLCFIASHQSKLWCMI